VGSDAARRIPLVMRVDRPESDPRMQSAASLLASPAREGAERPHVDPRIVLSSIGEAVYDWDIGSDRLSWSGNAHSLFGIEAPERLATGVAFDKALDPVSPSTRSEAILLGEGADAGSGVPYRLSYAIAQPGGGLAWFEDNGRWFAGADGRAATAHGAVRRTQGPTEAERQEIAAAKFDAQTGAYLRAPFLRLMADDFAKAQSEGKGSVFCLMAIDDLAFIKASYGFAAADETIAGVAQRLRTTMRRKDRFVRFSGAKLGVLLALFDQDAEVAEAARRFMAAVAAAPIQTSAGPVAVRLHVGCAVAGRGHGFDVVACVRRPRRPQRLPGRRRPRGGAAPQPVRLR
jgi:diguanylate cyclase (GGDEF)-like protein